jgi:hypothetical protein
MMNPRSHTDSKTIAIIVPAVRSVVISVAAIYADEDNLDGLEIEVHVFPVLALEFRQDEDGWATGTPLFFSAADYGTEVCRPEAIEAVNTTITAVSCPWDPSEDEERLAHHIEVLKGEAARKSEDYHRQKRRRVPQPAGAT